MRKISVALDIDQEDTWLSSPTHRLVLIPASLPPDILTHTLVCFGGTPFTLVRCLGLEKDRRHLAQKFIGLSLGKQ